jgi:predicted transcriptional regulator of viral defense system
MLDDPSLGGGLRPVVDVFRAYLNSSAKDLELLVSYAERLGNGAVYKRLGYLLERYSPGDKSAIGICRSRLSTGYAKLDPSLNSGGLVTRWRLWIPENWRKELNIDRPA